MTSPETFDVELTDDFPATVAQLFAAWTDGSVLQQWWGPVGFTCPIAEMDVRVGGKYRVEFGRDASSAMAFFGKYIDVTPHSRLAWTNEESADGAVTTVTFEEKGGKTLLVLHERYPSQEALDAALEGMEEGMPEQFEQLDELLLTLDASAG